MTTHAHRKGEFGNLGRLGTASADKKNNAYNHGTNANTVSERLKRGTQPDTKENHLHAMKFHKDAARAHMSAFKAGLGDAHRKIATHHRKQVAYHALTASKSTVSTSS